MLKMSAANVKKAVSCVVFSESPSQQRASIKKSPLQVYLIQREKDPAKGKWTFPGGKVEEKESLCEAINRELQEETGMIVTLYNEEQPEFVTHQEFTPEISFEISTFSGFIVG